MTPCVEAPGAKDKKGYGRKWFNGRVVRAHRLAYCLANGVDLESIRDLMVRHSCDNPPCINPEHLLLGTVQDNTNDREHRGRNRPQAAWEASKKVRDSDVEEIKRLYVKGSKEFGQRQLAERFGVTQPQISKILRGVQRA
ncbi:HNH endonuclease [Burkholderia humptydooensis]|uniref:HNH endonuclease n=1 Tax=Burkholderia humptydooensis TaxID=430531 RepID=UPI00095017FA